MPKLFISKEAIADVDEIDVRDPEAADEIWALLELAKSSSDVLDTFSAQDFGADARAPYHVARWNAQQRVGRNIWRIKIWDLERIRLQYRIVYAFDALNDRYYILGVFRRDWNYLDSDPRTQRIIAAYDRLDLISYH